VLQSSLALAAIEIVLGSRLEDCAVIFLSLVDLLKLSKAQESAQVVGVGHVAFAALPADKIVLPRVAHQQPLDVRIERASCPPGQSTCLDGEALLLCLDRRYARDQLRLSGRKLLVTLVGAILLHHAKCAGICM